MAINLKYLFSSLNEKSKKFIKSQKFDCNTPIQRMRISSLGNAEFPKDGKKISFNHLYRMNILKYQVIKKKSIYLT
jgi:hypothetical protein